MRAKATWAAAIVVFVAAAGFAFSVYGDSRAPSEAVVDDSAGDVVGIATDEQRRRLDIDRVRLSRSGGRYVIEFQMAGAASGGGPGEVLVFTARLTTGSATYNVRARVAGETTDATVVNINDSGRPYVLGDPEVDGRRVTIRIPDEAVKDLRSPFTWGTAVRIDGAEDKAPADSAAVFPGATP